MAKSKSYNAYAHGLFTAKTQHYEADYRACGHTYYGWKQRTALLHRLVPPYHNPSIDILDIGCGNGHMGERAVSGPE